MLSWLVMMRRRRLASVVFASVVFLGYMWLGPSQQEREMWWLGPTSYENLLEKRVIAMFAKATARPPVRRMDPVADCVAKCPHNPDSSFSDSPHAEKYLKRFDCSLDTGMWNWEKAKEPSREKFRRVGDLFGIDTQDYSVLDWGAGCGEYLDSLKQRNPSLLAIGVDLFPKNSEYMQSKTKIDCACDEKDASLMWLPPRSVDFFVSNAALYHLPVWKQCAFLQNQVAHAVDKCAIIMWSLGGSDMKGMNRKPHDDFWLSCIPDTFTGVIFSEQAFFGTSEYDDDAYSLLMCRKEVLK